jgi:hypothetical protein
MISTRRWKLRREGSKGKLLEATLAHVLIPSKVSSRGIKDQLTRETVVSILSGTSSSNALSISNSLEINVPHNRLAILQHARECLTLLL